MKIKLKPKITLVLLVAISLVTFSATMVFPQQDSGEQPVVTVNDFQINKSQLDEKMSSTFGYQTMMTLYKNRLTQILSYLQTEEAQTLMKLHLLNQLMVEELKTKKIGDLGLSVSDKEIESQIDQIIENNEDIKDRENLKQALQKQKMTMDQLKNSLRKNLLQGKLKDEVTGEIKVTEKEIESYYNENKKSFTDEEGNTKPLKEVSEKIEGILSDQEKQEKYDEWLQKTKKEAEVKFAEGFLSDVNEKLPGLKVSDLSFFSWTTN